MNEFWKDVVGYEGLYQVSNLGQVRSLPRPRSDGRYNWKGRILKPQLGSDRYLFISLWKGGKPTQIRINRLVLFAFVGPCPPGNYSNHKNGIRKDNRLDNLEWATPSENNIHAYRVLGRKPVINKHENNGFAKLTEADVAEIRRLRILDPKYWTLKRIGDKFGIGKSHTKRIIDFESWR